MKEENTGVYELEDEELEQVTGGANITPEELESRRKEFRVLLDQSALRRVKDGKLVR